MKFFMLETLTFRESFSEKKEREKDAYKKVEAKKECQKSRRNITAT